MKRVLILVLVLLISGCSVVVYEKENNARLEGPYEVVRAIDGDTLDVIIDGSVERIRFSGINTPEKDQCYYQEAKDKLKQLTEGKEVYLERDRSDVGKYGRLLRYVYVNNLMINSYMVRNGYAFVFDKYKDDTGRYEELKENEKIAMAKNLGVWDCD